MPPGVSASGVQPEQAKRSTEMRFQRFAAISAAFVIFASSSAFAQMAPAKTADTSKGKTLVDNKGMTLYVFDKDAGKNCPSP